MFFLKSSLKLLLFMMVLPDLALLISSVYLM